MEVEFTGDGEYVDDGDLYLNEDTSPLYGLDGEYFPPASSPQYPAPDLSTYAPSSQGYMPGYGSQALVSSTNYMPSAFQPLSQPTNLYFGASNPPLYSFAPSTAGDLSRFPFGNSQIPRLLPRAPTTPNLAIQGSAPVMTGNSTASRNRSTVEVKKPGRNKPLTPENRQSTKLCRDSGSCLFHTAKKTKCITSSKDGDRCDHCVKTSRICYRGKRYTTDLLDPLKTANDAILEPFLKDAVAPELRFPLEFEVEITSQGIRRSSVPVELRSSTARHPKSRPLGLGTVSPDTLLGIGLEIFDATGVLKDRSWDEGQVELPYEAKRCLAWHLLLKTLSKAMLCSSQQRGDCQALKSFIASIVEVAVTALRKDLERAIVFVKTTIPVYKEKVYDDPSHLRLAFCLAALCRIVQDMMNGQAAAVAGNTLAAAVYSTIPQAALYFAEIQCLGRAFYAIKDSNPDTNEFDQMIEEALPEESRSAHVELRIAFDPSESESSRALGGNHVDSNRQDGLPEERRSRLPAFVRAGNEFTNSRISWSRPAASLFGRFRSQGGDFFQYQHGPLLAPDLGTGPSIQPCSGEWKTLSPCPPPPTDLYNTPVEMVGGNHVRLSEARTGEKRQRSVGPRQKHGKGRR